MASLLRCHPAPAAAVAKTLGVLGTAIEHNACLRRDNMALARDAADLRREVDQSRREVDQSHGELEKLARVRESTDAGPRSECCSPRHPARLNYILSSVELHDIL